MKLRLALAAATCLAMPLAAHAQPVFGPYVNLEGGTSIQNPVNFSQTDNFGDSRGGEKMLYKPSYAGVAGIGFGFGDGFRVQLDGNFYHNTVSKVDFSDYGFNYSGAKVVGREDKYGPMVNLLYDIPVDFPITPYVGAGAGYQWINAKYHSGMGLNTAENFDPGVAFSGAGGSFAFDIIAGASYALPMVPGLSLTAEYRFMMLTSSTKLDYSILGGEPLGSPNDAGTIKFSQQSSHTFLFGLRYVLFPAAVMAPAPAPAPAPAASPAPVPAKTYLVFFDWDKSTLTPRATQIIAEAASDSKTTSVTTISVSGYTDTSGTPVYNQGLSERRASAVAAQLVTDGVPASEIETHAYGETHLLVPTGPGVREPQNRRVEIVLD
jgi:outer membrane protein OmpA-like peptidoglycan-associated protein